MNNMTTPSVSTINRDSLIDIKRLAKVMINRDYRSLNQNEVKSLLRQYYDMKMRGCYSVI